MMETELKEDRNEGPPRKRLLTDPNPKQRFVTASPESTVSSDSSSDRVTKRTRELPNLSDCHSCSVRINYSNPRERLQPLDSMWRIVLLCKKCYKRVKSSQLCSYCFSSIVDGNDCFKCRDCQHSIHKDCVEKYGSGLGFSVCVDCWVPDAVVNSIRARKRKFRKKNNELCEQTATLPESRVSVAETIESNSVEEEVEKKVAAAAQANENAKGVLNFVASRKVAGSSLRGDDASITCYSRKRVKKAIVMNSDSLDIPLMCYYRRRFKGGLNKSSSLENEPLMRCYKRRYSSKACPHDKECECLICKVSRIVDKHVSNCGSSSENGFNGNKCQENDEEIKPHPNLLKYFRTGKGITRPSVFGKDFDCDSCMDFANFVTEDKESHEICEKCDDNNYHFLLTYNRTKRSKPEFSCKFEEWVSTVLPSNHPKESKTLSATRFLSGDL